MKLKTGRMNVIVKLRGLRQVRRQLRDLADGTKETVWAVTAKKGGRWRRILHHTLASSSYGAANQWEFKLTGPISAGLVEQFRVQEFILLPRGRPKRLSRFMGSSAYLLRKR